MTRTELSKLRSVAVQSSPLHRVQLVRPSSCLSPSSLHPRASSTKSPRRVSHQWQAIIWLVFTLSLFYCLKSYGAHAVATTLETESKSKSDAVTSTSSTSSDLYIVLVSIPVLEKMLPLKHLAESLLSRGVRVGFALPEHCRPVVQDLEDLEFLSLGDIPSQDRMNRSDFVRFGVYESYVHTLRYYASFERPMYDTLVAHLETHRPDLVVVDRYTFAGFDACQRLEVPYVVNSPSMLLDIDSPPPYIPAPFSNYTMHTLSVFERCLNFYYRLRFRLGLVQVFKDINTVRQDYGLDAIHSKQQLHGHALVLVNSIFGLDEARALTPQFRMVGLLQSKQMQRERTQVETSSTTGRHRFSSPLALWLEAPELQSKPLIYMSLTTLLTADEINLIINALESINVRLLWKLTLQEQKTFNGQPPHHDWVFLLNEESDDDAVLTLVPDIALFVTSGEYQMILEALCFGVPLLGLPYAAEELEGINAVTRAGAGSQLDWSSLTETTFRRAVDEIVYDQKEYFKNNAVYLGELLKAGGGTERAVDELLAVAEFGAFHLLPMQNLQPLYKTFLVDVYLIYGAILCGAAIILRTFVAVVWSIFQPLLPSETLRAQGWSK